MSETNQSTTTHECLSQRFWDDAEHRIHIRAIGGTVVCATGLICNYLSFIILRRMYSSVVATYYLLSILAVVDSIYLVLSFCYYNLSDLNGLWKFGFINYHYLDPVLLAPYPRYYTSVAQLTGKMYRNWLIAMISIERWLQLSFPLKSRALITPKRCKFAVVGLFCFCFITHAYHWHFIILKSVYNDCPLFNRMMLGQAVHSDGQVISRLMNITFIVAMPFIFLSITNIALIRILIKATSRRKKISQSSSVGTGDMQATMLALSSVIIYLICESPTIADRILIMVGIRNMYLSPLKPVLSQVDSCVNFFLYCLSSAKFRRIFSNTFCKYR
ncbi:FMRFamide receptor-like [Tubulanus polymorphus]|uniref:FMRFamide receptor-like n=1 Tax=Tubulanus polymorphus TaxID=672921 RepID=UPI003DA2A711